MLCLGDVPAFRREGCWQRGGQGQPGQLLLMLKQGGVVKLQVLGEEEVVWDDSLTVAKAREN